MVVFIATVLPALSSHDSSWSLGARDSPIEYASETCERSDAIQPAGGRWQGTGGLLRRPPPHRVVGRTTFIHSLNPRPFGDPCGPSPRETIVINALRTATRQIGEPRMMFRRAGRTCIGPMCAAIGMLCLGACDSTPTASAGSSSPPATATAIPTATSATTPATPSATPSPTSQQPGTGTATISGTADGHALSGAFTGTLQGEAPNSLCSLSQDGVGRSAFLNGSVAGYPVHLGASWYQTADGTYQLNTPSHPYPTGMDATVTVGAGQSGAVVFSTAGGAGTITLTNHLHGGRETATLTAYSPAGSSGSLTIDMSWSC